MTSGLPAEFIERLGRIVASDDLPLVLESFAIVAIVPGTPSSSNTLTPKSGLACVSTQPSAKPGLSRGGRQGSGSRTGRGSTGRSATSSR